jgi:DNA-binding SARP family transcriptional activator
MFIEALEQVIQLLEDRHDYLNAIHYAQELLRCDPLYESTHRHLMRLHALSGNRAAALRVYQQCVTLLRRELNVEPSVNTHRLYEDLVENRHKLAPSNSTISISNIETPLIGREERE